MTSAWRSQVRTLVADWRNRAAATGMKTASYAGETIHLFGDGADPYFRDAGFDKADNRFFRHVIGRRLAKDAVVFDIGANIGLTTVMLSKAVPHGAVYSFEPSPRAAAHLKAVVARNGLRNVEAVPLALSSEAGEVTFQDNPQSAAASHLVAATSLGGDTTRVPAMTLDQFVEQRGLARLDFLKIDVEGFEMSVLDGARKTLETFRPDVFVEFNSFTLIAYGDVNPRRFAERLRDSFTHVYGFAGGQPTLIDSDGALLGLIHRNLAGDGCVDDLYCTFRGPMAWESGARLQPSSDRA